MKKGLVVYVAALHLALAALVVRDAMSELRVSEKPAALQWTFAMHQQLDAQVRPGAVVFLGDSITASADLANVDPDAVDFGMGGAESADLLREVGELRSLSRARAVVITIGTNDVVDGRAAGLAQRYRELLTKMPAGVPVVMSSIPPVERPGKQEIARQAAQEARAACEADQRCRFVDLFSALADSSGHARPGMLWDGVHLTAQAYAAWMPMLRDALHRQAP